MLRCGGLSGYTVSFHQGKFFGSIPGAQYPTRGNGQDTILGQSFSTTRFPQEREGLPTLQA